MVLEPEPFPVKELVKRKYRYKKSYKKIAQSQRNGNHNPSEFHWPEVRRYTNVEEFELCAIPKSQELKQHFGHISSQLTLFTTTDLAKR